jgi:hypothetical protein
VLAEKGPSSNVDVELRITQSVCIYIIYNIRGCYSTLGGVKSCETYHVESPARGEEV